MRILVIEDEKKVAEFVARGLRDHRFAVDISSDGQSGLEMAKACNYDLIVLDLMMEKHDSGFGFAKTLKADPLYKNIPVLLLTAVAESTGYDFSQELDGYWMKTDDYASKPLLPEELLKRVQNLLARSKGDL